MHVSVPDALSYSSTTVSLDMIQALNRQPFTAAARFPPFRPQIISFLPSLYALPAVLRTHSHVRQLAARCTVSR